MEPTSNARADRPAPAARRVLVVDDDADNRSAIADVLESEGFGVLVASNGAEALAALHASPDGVGVVLLDFVMPTMDGRAFLSEQRRSPELAAIPVIVVSAQPGLDVVAEALGHVSYLRKPFHLADLLAAVSQYCSPRALQPSRVDTLPRGRP